MTYNHIIKIHFKKPDPGSFLEAPFKDKGGGVVFQCWGAAAATAADTMP